jgi:hypothetical protein
MDERGATRSASRSEREARSFEQASSATLNILTIAAGGRRFGVDGAEVERVVTGSEALAREKELLGDLRERGLFYRLEELLPGGRPGGGPAAAFVLKSEEGRSGLVAFDGEPDVIKIEVASVMPVPDFVRRVQKPLFVWGFVASRDGLITLVTFQYLAGEGAA